MCWVCQLQKNWHPLKILNLQYLHRHSIFLPQTLDMIKVQLFTYYNIKRIMKNGTGGVELFILFRVSGGVNSYVSHCTCPTGIHTCPMGSPLGFMSCGNVLWWRQVPINCLPLLINVLIFFPMLSMVTCPHFLGYFSWVYCLCPHSSPICVQ